jgi:cytochrome P450
MKPSGDADMTATDLYWDTYTPEIWEDPYPIYKRMRAEAPVYYNAEHDFYAFSRFDDIDRGLADWQTFSSARGNILEFIKAGMDLPPGTVIMEDPPTHDINRGVLARLFAPRRVAGLEPQIRDFIAKQLDPLQDADSFDIIDVLSDKVPMSVIGMLMGIPEKDRQAVRDQTVAALATGEGGKLDPAEAAFVHAEMFGNYIDWRIKNPSDDLMTELLTAEFDDAEGVRRTLTRDEALVYATVVAGAGNDTTGQLIGWMGKVLAEHPDAWAQLVANPNLIDSAVEEIIRLEPIGHAVGRYVTKDVEFHGQTIPAGSAALFIVASANRDESKYEDGDVLDITRKIPLQRSFGLGNHYCLGAALARLEGRLVLDELIKRFPKGWDIDWDNASLNITSTVRGWGKLPIVIRK